MKRTVMTLLVLLLAQVTTVFERSAASAASAPPPPSTAASATAASAPSSNLGATGSAPSAAPAPISGSNSDLASIVRKLRDPFKMIQSENIDLRQRTDLQSVPIDEIKVVGILTGPARTRAIVKAAGKTYVVGEGMRMGIDDELMKEISTNGITVVGSRVNLVGDREAVTTEIPLILDSKKLEAKSQTSVTSTPADSNPLSAGAGGAGTSAGASENFGGQLNPAHGSAGKGD